MTSISSIMLMTLCAINSFEDELDCSILLEGGSEMPLELVAFDSDEVLGGATSELEETGAPSILSLKMQVAISNTSTTISGFIS